LRLCGWKGDPQFEKGIYDQVFDYTDGVPRRVNKLCDRVMLHGCVEELHMIGDADIKSVIGEERHEIQNAREVAVPGGKKPAANARPGSKVQPLRPETATASDAPRILELEKKLEQLENTIRNDRKRFQRMIMMLALSDESDEELVDVLKDLSNADKT
ncbi:MAG: hypothetical protein WBO06_15245, partial [Gammaproteobacteria bacterium]